VVGRHIEIHDGKVFLRDLAGLAKEGVNGESLKDAVHDKRIEEPLEGVEIKGKLHVDSVTQGTVVYRYLFLKNPGNVYLLAITEGHFTEQEVAYFTDLARNFGKG